MDICQSPQYKYLHHSRFPAISLTLLNADLGGMCIVSTLDSG